ncbi:MAG TPA: PAS domain S-box protein [Spirochaetia bacterium]|nr:PAS domain S-box protein [Spirochaetia bacterium]
MDRTGHEDKASRYQKLIDTMPDGYYRSTHSGRFLEVNRAFAAMLGYSVSELLNVEIPKELYFSDRERQSGDRNTSFGSATEIYRLRKRDGSEVWVEDFARYEREPDGGIRFHEGICRDITLRRRSEEAERREAVRSQIIAELTTALLDARLDPQRVLDLSVRRCVELIGDGASIFLYSPGETYLTLAAVFNKDPSAIDLFRSHYATHPIRFDQGSHGRVISTNQSLLVPSVDMTRFVAGVDESFREYYTRLPIYGAMFAPLRSEGRCIGVLGIGRHDAARPTYTPDDLALFQEVADQAAVALSAARLYDALERELEEKRRVEEELRESEERYRQLVDMSPDGIVVEVEDRIAYLNPSAIGLIGAESAERVLGKPIMDFLHAESLEDVDERQSELESATEPISLGERTIIRLDGRALVVEAEGVNVPFRGKRAFQVVFRDITARKESERQLRLQGAALNTADNGIIITDKVGTIVWANPAFARLTGYSVDEAIGKDPRTLIRSGTHTQEFYNAIIESMKRGEVWHGEIVNRRKDGTLYIEEMTISPVRDDSGEISHFVQIKQEITERRRAEEQLKSSLLEKDVLLREVHHRVKNNLQVISSLMSLQADRVEDVRFKPVFTESRHRIRAMALVHEKLYRSDNLARVNFGEYLMSVAGELFLSYAATRIAKQFELEPIPLDVDIAIPAGLIANELITNALRHGFPDGRTGTITVGLKNADPDIAELYVQDDGVGFPPDRDFRAMTSMGMILVLSLTKQIKGSISLDPSNGARFTVRIPIVR